MHVEDAGVGTVCVKAPRPSGIFGDGNAQSVAQIAMPPLRRDPSLPLSLLTNLLLRAFLVCCLFFFFCFPFNLELLDLEATGDLKRPQ